MSTGFLTKLAGFNRQILPDILTRKYPDLVFEGSSKNTVLPTEGGLQAGKQYIVELEQSDAGSIADGDQFGDEGSDIPIVDVGLDETTHKIFAIKRAYSFTHEEMEAVAAGSFDITDARASVCRKTIAQVSNRAGAYGAPRRGIPGMLNSSLVPTVSSTFDMTAASAQQVADFLGQQIQGIEGISEMSETPDMLLMSPGHYNKLQRTMIPGTSDTILAFLVNAFSSSGRRFSIMKVNECKASNIERFGVLPPGSNKDRLVLYSMSKDLLVRKVEAPTKFPEEYSNGRYRTILRQRVSEVIIRYPMSMRYIDLPKSLEG